MVRLFLSFFVPLQLVLIPAAAFAGPPLAPQNSSQPLSSSIVPSLPFARKHLIPTPSPTPAPSSGSSGGSGSEIAAVAGLVTMLGGGTSGLGGILGGASSGGGPYPGTTDFTKYGQQIDYSQKYVNEATKDDEQHPGDKRRDVQCEPERKESAQTSNPDAKNLGSVGDKIVGVYGPEFDDGPVKAIAEQTGMQYESPNFGTANSSVITDIEETAAGERINPATGEPQNLIVVYECHGKDDFLQSDGGDGGIYGMDLASANNRGVARREKSGKKGGNVTIIDGGCFSGRCRTMKENAKGDNVHAATGADPANYAWHSGGQSHIATQLADILMAQPAPAMITPATLQQAVTNVGNGAYSYRLAPGRRH